MMIKAMPTIVSMKPTSIPLGRAGPSRHGPVGTLASR
jgi:hypothetical protein